MKNLYHAVPDDAPLAGSFGGVIVGERGWITSMSAGGKIEGGPASLVEEMNAADLPVTIPGGSHHGNWVECIRTRGKTTSHEEIGHRAAALGELTIITNKLGRSLKWDPVNETFPGDDQANRLLRRARALEHDPINKTQSCRGQAKAAQRASRSGGTSSVEAEQAVPHSAVVKVFSIAVLSVTTFCSFVREFSSFGSCNCHTRVRSKFSADAKMTCSQETRTTSKLRKKLVFGRGVLRNLRPIQNRRQPKECIQFEVR